MSETTTETVRDAAAAPGSAGAVEKEPEVYSFSRLFRRIAPLCVKVSPGAFIINGALAVVSGVGLALNIPARQRLFDAVAAAAGTGSRDVTAVVWAGVFVVVLVMFNQILNGMVNLYIEQHLTIVRGRLTVLVHRKSAALPAIAFEDKSRLDDINKAGAGVENAVRMFISFAALFIFYIPYFACVLFYLSGLKPVFTVFLVLIFVPVCLSQAFRTRLYAKLENESAPLRRESDHYEQCICGREFFKETRLLGAYRYFRGRFMDTLTLLTNKQTRTEIILNLLNIAMNLLTLAGYAGIVFMLFRSLMAGGISVGAFAAVYASVEMLFSVCHEIFDNHIPTCMRNLGSITNFVRFLDIPLEAGEPAVPDYDKGIVARGVSFTYPGAARKSLDNITLTIRPGETIAVVGENGSGKSTLVKLLTGLYTPTEGTVLIGGVDSSRASRETLYTDISAVFQNFQQYKLTLEENITISDGANRCAVGGARRCASGGDSRDASGGDSRGAVGGISLGASGGDSCDASGGVGRGTSGSASRGEAGGVKDAALDAAVAEAAARADVDLGDAKTFPQGKDTVLSREFDGVDLSGGQWQRVAIARGLFRKCRFIVLDEPTAAIDPIEETRVYQRFAAISRGLTSIIVTHRLGSARIADRIIVMDGGRIVEEGTHDALTTAAGKYAHMWSLQARQYG